MRKQKLLFVIALTFTAIGIFISWQVSRPAAPHELIAGIGSRIQQVIQEVDKEAAEILAAENPGKKIRAASFQFLIVRADSVVSWNDHHFIPSLNSLTGDFSIKFLKIGYSEFLVKKWKLSDTEFLIANIPLHIQYKITNNYLAPLWNRKIFPTDGIILIDPSEGRGFPVLIDGLVIFNIFFLPNADYVAPLWSDVIIIFLSLALIILIWLVMQQIDNMAHRNPWMGFILLAFLVCLVRVGMVLLKFPARFTNSVLFDAKYFASSELSPSLADLVLNSVAVLILCLYLFRNRHRFPSLPLRSRSFISPLVSIFSVVCILFGMLFPYVVTQTIYNNSAITLSIAESIHFDSLRIVAYISIVAAWISSFFFMHIFLRLLGSEKRFGVLTFAVVAGCSIFIQINMTTGQTYFWSLLSGALYLACVVSFSLHKSLLKFQYTTFAYFFIAVIFLSINGMFAVRNLEQQDSVTNQVRFANNFLSERDNFAEYLLHETTERVASDAFIQSRMASPFLGKEVIVQKIKRVSLSGYFNQYNVEVRLFSTTGEPLTGSDTLLLSSVMNAYKRDAFKTDYESIYCVTSPQGDFSRRYIVFIPMVRNEAPAGYIVIELTLKRIIPENVYPELLIDNRFQQGFQTQALSYAIVYEKNILFSAGEFNYESIVQNGLDDPLLYTQGINHGGQVHIATEDVNGRITIVSSPETSRVFWLAEFSFQVILGMSMVLFFLLVQGLMTYFRSRRLFFAARIQLILNLAFFVPLIAVSIITLGLTTQSSQEQLRNEFLSRTNRFGGEVSVALFETHEDFSEFENQFTSLTALANLDGNVFYPTGQLMTTSQPLIFESHILSRYINPSVLSRIKRGDKVFVSDEQVGSLKFYVAYTALFAPNTGELLGILGIPFFQSATSLEHLQIAVLANTLSIFTLIFVALLIASFIVTRWLTSPLQMITKQIGQISLTSANIPLQWRADDEIGLLVREYNLMLVKLNESKQEVERNQRERTWREIAQQVAHEIKNPLTPMKLTLQQLDRALQKEGQQDEKLIKTVNLLLTQINLLDTIASSFSTFAKMPEPVMADVELVNLLTKTVSLYVQEGRVELKTNLSSATTKGDEQLLIRIFSNLILNGLQASEPESSASVIVTLEERDADFLVSVKDHGSGIDPAVIDKIFLPHFTTKQSGSGLGLAIAKQGIEQMGGKIWFETSSRGTIFTVELSKSKPAK